MICDCPKCSCENETTKNGSSSSFIFGLVLGAVIGAIVAVVIYRQNKGKIFEDLQKKLEDFFKNLISNPDKTKTNIKSKPVIAQKIIIEDKKEEIKVDKPEIVFVKKKPIPKTFIKSKK